MDGQQLKKILHVEDEPDIRAIARMALEKLGGFTLLQCAGGGEALAAAPGFGPDLILLDVMMPQMDGGATLEALRKLPSAAAIPVIFMTAKVRREERDALMKLGAIGVIAKPFNPMTLAAEVRRLWDQRSA
jgi:two-component system, OmpR family, response regulator